MCGIDRWSQVLGMAMGQVWAGFFNTQTHPMGQDPLPELGPFNKRVFFAHLDPPHWAPAGPI